MITPARFYEPPAPRGANRSRSCLAWAQRPRRRAHLPLQMPRGRRSSGAARPDRNTPRRGCAPTLRGELEMSHRTDRNIPAEGSDGAHPTRAPRDADGGAPAQRPRPTAAARRPAPVVEAHAPGDSLDAQRPARDQAEVRELQDAVRARRGALSLLPGSPRARLQDPQPVLPRRPARLRARAGLDVSPSRARAAGP